MLADGTPEARMGLAIGQIVGGLAVTLGGLTGEVFGGITSATGVGAAIGVPAIAVSTGLVVGGIGNIAAGIQGLSQALMSSGSASTSPQGTALISQRASNSGETAATAAGRAAHKAWRPPPGFQKEFRLPSGRRPDAVNPKTREVIELKPIIRARFAKNKSKRKPT
ncbi:MULTISPECIES: hypothetical protein [Sorangium]|uniref:hypothetical protein n=1 Tax=Sorangium TaxID=39643 RepID=UPI003D9C623D